MDPEDAATAGDAEGLCRPGALGAVLHLGAVERPEEPLVGGGEQDRPAQVGQVRRVAEQFGGHLGRLAEVEAGVEHDPLPGDAGGLGPASPFGQEVLEEGGVGEAADVVADAGTGLEACLDHGAAEGVDGDGHVEAMPQRLDGGDDPVDLLGGGHLRAGCGPGAAHVEDVGAFGDVPLGEAEELVEVPVPAPVVEGVGGAVQYCHHDAAVGDVERPVGAQLEEHVATVHGTVGQGGASRRTRRWPAGWSRVQRSPSTSRTVPAGGVPTPSELGGPQSSTPG